MTATLAEVGLTVREAMALMEAGEPPPPRPGPRDTPEACAALVPITGDVAC